MSSRRKTQKGGELELMTQADAARHLNITRAAVSYLVSNNVLRSKEMLGRLAVYRADVEAYKPKTSSENKSKKGKGKKK